MTNIQNHVTCLELSKKLWELGVRKESVFYWQGNDETGYVANLGIKFQWDGCQSIPAYLSSEVGEMLPLRVDAKSKKDGRRTIAYFMEYHIGGLSVRYVHHLDTHQVLWEESENKEADARAAMLIYLLEQGLISLEEINK